MDGLAFLKKGDTDEYQAILWLRDEAPMGRLVEAVGGDYSEFGRISSSTGLPTLLGWKGHEQQWRGSRKPFAGKEDRVKLIYTSNDSQEVERLLGEDSIRYVYVGSRERREYGAYNLEEFSNQDSFLRTVFQSGGVVIYELKSEEERKPMEGDDAGAS